ncbi:MAG: hypothetical protein PVI69_02290, partial [Desulfobacterales bacterium]
MSIRTPIFASFAGGRSLFGIFDPVVMNGVEYFVEALGDVVQVLEGELTVVELSVGKNLVDQILHKALDSGRRGIGQSP